MLQKSTLLIAICLLAVFFLPASAQQDDITDIQATFNNIRGSNRLRLLEEDAVLDQVAQRILDEEIVGCERKIFDTEDEYALELGYPERETVVAIHTCDPDLSIANAIEKLRYYEDAMGQEILLNPIYRAIGIVRGVKEDNKVVYVVVYGSVVHQPAPLRATAVAVQPTATLEATNTRIPLPKEEFHIWEQFSESRDFSLIWNETLAGIAEELAANLQKTDCLTGDLHALADSMPSKASFVGDVNPIYRCYPGLSSESAAVYLMAVSENILDRYIGIAAVDNEGYELDIYVVVFGRPRIPLTLEPPIITLELTEVADLRFAPTDTPTPTDTQTVTPSPTFTFTSTLTDTPTPIDTPTVTPSLTFTFTPTDTPSLPPTLTETLLPLPTETMTPEIVSPTNTLTLTSTETSTPTATPSPTPSLTPTSTRVIINGTPPDTMATAEISEVKMVFYYLDNNHLGLRFDVAEPQKIWLYGLSFEWTDTDKNSHTLNISDFPLDTALEGLTSDQCIEFYVVSPAGNIPGCSISETFSIPLTDTNNRFWLVENAVFSVHWGQQTLNTCSTTGEATCTVTWLNSSDNLLLAPIEMVMEWTNDQLMIVRFRTISPTIDLSGLQFVIRTTGGNRYYRLREFDELVAQTNISRFLSSGCILLGSNPNVQRPLTTFECSVLYFDSVGVAERGSAFWAYDDGFTVSYDIRDNPEDIPLGNCPTQGHTSCTIPFQK